MRRLVLKVGSAVLTTKTGKLATKRLTRLVELITELKQKSEYDIILVSSGAVAAGNTVLKLNKSIISNRQALASIGQPHLMATYKNRFKKRNIICSQVLLEKSLFKDNERLRHARDTIDTLLENGVLPIINENDVTAVDELVFGDNDQLSAYITEHFYSNLLVILTDIDGYYNKNPKIYKNAKLLLNVSKIDECSLDEICSANSEFATGGIVTKLRAADYLMKRNKRMFLSSGFNLEVVKEFLMNRNNINEVRKKGTLFGK